MENDAKRLHIPLPLLFCFALFAAWRMGVIHFSSKTLSVDGGTPLLLMVGDLSLVIAAGYGLSIIWMIFLPRLIVWAQRITAGAALLSAAALFLPISPGALEAVNYFNCFCCIFLIGFENAVITWLFREETAVRHLTLAYALAMFLAALLQNDTFRVPFPVFRCFIAAAAALQLFFYCKLPAGVWPRFVKKTDGLFPPPPLRLFFGVFFLGAIGSLMLLFGIGVAETIPNGEMIFYGALGLCGAAMFIVWKRLGVSVLRLGSAGIGIAVIGFILALLSLYIPALSLPVCIALGCGGIVCWFVPLFCLTLAKIYPSRFISPVMMALALGAVLLHEMILNAFRDRQQILYVSYLVIAVSLGVLYLMLEPYLTYSFQEKPAEKQPAEKPRADSKFGASFRLTAQELRVTELFLRGFSYTETAKTLGLQPNTVKWHQKNIYAKLHINSKRELFALAEKSARTAAPKEKNGGSARPLLVKR